MSRGVVNDVTFGYNRNVRDFNNPQNPSVTYTQNIYNPVTLPAPIRPETVADLPNNSHDEDYYVSDTLTLGRLRLLGGVRQISYTSDSVAKGGKHLTTQQSVLAPSAVVNDVNRGLSVYASYLQLLEESGQAPVNAANAYNVLPPAPEIGRAADLRPRALNHPRLLHDRQRQRDDGPGDERLRPERNDDLRGAEVHDGAQPGPPPHLQHGRPAHARAARLDRRPVDQREKCRRTRPTSAATPASRTGPRWAVSV